MSASVVGVPGKTVKVGSAQIQMDMSCTVSNKISFGHVHGGSSHTSRTFPLRKVCFSAV